MTTILEAPLELGTVTITDGDKSSAAARGGTVVTVNAAPRVTIMLGPKLDGTVDTKGFDLDDLHKDWKPGDVFYDSTLNTPGNLLRATLFLETLAGMNDVQAAFLLAKMKQAMPREHYTLQPFTRPQGALSWRICAAIAPRSPKGQVLNTFNRLNGRFGIRHYAAAIPMMALVFGLIALQSYFLKWTLLSPVTLTDKLLGDYGYLTIPIILGLLWLDRKFGRRVRGVSFSPYMSGFFNRAATSEEQAFREGAENWSRWERARSCIAFALIHQPSMVYIFGMIIPHAVMGAVFMAVYQRNFKKHGVRRNAVLAASIFHRLYNRIALVVLVGSLLLYFSSTALHWVMAIACIGIVWTSMAVTDLMGRHRRH